MLYLASQSPRRKDLLSLLGVPFSVLPPAHGVDMEALEAAKPNEQPLRYVRRVTLAKLKAALQQAQLGAHDAVLVADTTVALGAHILGKPGNASSNAAMLTQLQGRTHRVMTALALAHQGHVWQTVQMNHVTFAPLDAAQIQAYAASGEGWDKAGGYAIQGAAAVFVQQLRGNYTGVMGLPLFDTAQLFKQAGL